MRQILEKKTPPTIGFMMLHIHEIETPSESRITVKLMNQKQEVIEEYRRIFIGAEKMNTPTPTTPESENTTYLLSLYEELSETRKKEAINILETLVNEDIKDGIQQAGKELLEYQQGKRQSRSIDELLAEL